MNGGTISQAWISRVVLSGILFIGPTQAQNLEHLRLLESTEQVLGEIANIRKLIPLEPVKKGIQSKEQIRSFLIERIQKDYPVEEIEAEEHLLKKLQLLPPELDYYDFMLDFLTEQLAGYYDPFTDTLYIADWLPVMLQEQTLAHELVHALQDQHFDLERFVVPIEGNDDRTLAAGALVEGEALLIGLALYWQSLGVNVLEVPDIISAIRTEMKSAETQFAIFAAAPEYLKELFVFPYAYGANFIQSYVRRNSWSALGELYSDTPQSTEQILHPDKFFGERDEPVEMDTHEMREKLTGTWTSVYKNVLGEFRLYLFLNQYLDRAAALEGAAGWGGDAIELLTNSEGQTALLIDSLWDSPLEAREFVGAAERMFRLRTPSVFPWSETRNGDEYLFEGTTSSQMVTIHAKGSRVSLLELER